MASEVPPNIYYCVTHIWFQKKLCDQSCICVSKAFSSQGGAPGMIHFHQRSFPDWCLVWAWYLILQHHLAGDVGEFFPRLHPLLVCWFILSWLLIPSFVCFSRSLWDSHFVPSEHSAFREFWFCLLWSVWLSNSWPFPPPPPRHSSNIRSMFSATSLPTAFLGLWISEHLIIEMLKIRGTCCLQPHSTEMQSRCSAKHTHKGWKELIDSGRHTELGYPVSRASFCSCKVQNKPEAQCEWLSWWELRDYSPKQVYTSNRNTDPDYPEKACYF